MKLEAKVEENDLMPIQLFDDGDVVREFVRLFWSQVCERGIAS